jgi:endonuclease G
VTWKFPLEVSIRIGDIVPPIMTKAIEEQRVSGDKNSISLEEAITIDRSYENRNGYDPKFLPGYKIPLPKLSNRQKRDAARKIHVSEGEKDPYELRYQHFSIVMNAKRRMAFFTAVNIDGSTLISINRGTGEPRESEAEAGERWYEDPRINLDAQSDQSLYNNQRPRVFDRGHLVRREDPNWGTPARAKRANADTFHVTNCALQEKGFNRGAQLWLGIEEYILDNARAEREKLVVFTGPIFEEDDAAYRYTKVPKQFWKIIARIERGQLLASALLADQSDRIRSLPERFRGERFDDTSEIAEFQTSIRTVQELTNLDFGSLREYDTFRQGPEALATDKVKLRHFSEIILER